VTGLKGPLEDGWEGKVRAFVTRIPVSGEVPGSGAGAPKNAQPEASAV
jgi:hypothetical protein